MLNIAVVWHSEKGETDMVARLVGEGISQQPRCACSLVRIDANGKIDEEGWRSCNEAKGIIFGSPTHFASYSWCFARFASDSRSLWFEGAWHDKAAAGFTVAGSAGGGGEAALAALFQFAMQHGMLWTSSGMKPAAVAVGGVNPHGTSLGLLVASEEGGSDRAEDQETARLFGRRFARLLQARHGV